MKAIATIILCIVMWCGSTACGRDTSGYRNVGADEFENEIASEPSAYVLDVRTPEEFSSGHIEGAHNLDWRNPAAFSKGVESLPKGSTIYIYCRSGARSSSAADFLTGKGFRVVNLRGGLNEWNSR